jgi:tetratricopeptide (TPR) repeat protein
MRNYPFKKLVLSTVFAVTAVILSAQTRDDVVKAYNDGAKASATDVKAAIASFETAIQLADKVGESANDMKQKATQVLPGLYFKVAYAALNEKKPASEIIQSAKTAMSVAEKYNNESNKTNALKVLTQGYNLKAGEYFAKSDFDNALKTYDTLLSVNPGYVNAFFNKATIYMKQNNSAAVEENIDAYLGKLKPGTDDAKIKQTSQSALEYFRASGSKASQAEKLDDALSMLNKAAKYGEDKDLYYYFADVYNKKKNFDSALESAQKGLALETGADDAKAKFYFQIGLAQEGKGQTAEACGSFKNSLFGPFAEPSKAKRTNLKCK